MAGKRTSKGTGRRGKKQPTPKRACFAIMPFGGWFDQYWQEIYRPAIEAAGLIAHRADDVFRPGTIMSDIWRSTRCADVLLADLTTRNGNVFYELGLAHAIGKPAVIVSESIEDVPFDLRGLRIVLYERKQPDWGMRLREAVRNALKETMMDPTLAVPSTFVQEREHSEQPTLTTGQLELLALRQDVELLKRQIAARDSDEELRSFYNATTGQYGAGKASLAVAAPWKGRRASLYEFSSADPDADTNIERNSADER